MRGEIVYVDGSPVDNVLVHPGESSSSGTMDASNITDWVGPIADYILYFPITYTERLDGRTVEVRGITCDIIGHPDHERPQHVFEGWAGEWDMMVRAKRTQAEKMEYITVIVRTASRASDGSGRREEPSDDVIFEGYAQARKDTGSESKKKDGTESKETFMFVLDWDDRFASTPTQRLFVSYNGKEYNITSVTNKDEEGITAVLRGEWHD